MTEKKKLDAGNILTKNSIETGDQDVIYGSLHKLRRYLINVDSVKEFHQAGGIGNLIILYKKYSVILISLHTKKSTKNDGDPKIDPKLNKIIHESLGLLGNCCHFDKSCKLAVKNTQLLSNLGKNLKKQIFIFFNMFLFSFQFPCYKSTKFASKLFRRSSDFWEIYAT